jgi:hypothetical protein
MQESRTQGQTRSRLFAIAVSVAWAYLSAVLLTNFRGLPFDFGPGLWFLSTLVVYFTASALSNWLVRRQFLSPATIVNIATFALATIVGLFCLDIGYSAYLNSNRSVLDYDQARLFDENIWIGELYPRIYYPTERNFRLHKPNVRVAGQPLGNFYSTPMLDSPRLNGYVLQRQPVDIQINSIGFRESSSISDAEIIALGDSFTFGWGVNAPDSWVGRLESKIGKAIYNFGIHDASPRQELELLKFMLENYPDELRGSLVLWMIYEGNDLEDHYNEQVQRLGQPENVPLFEGTAVELPRRLQVTLKRQSVISQLGRADIRWNMGRDHKQVNPYEVDGIKLDNPFFESPKLGPKLFYRANVERATKPESYFESHKNIQALESVFEEMRSVSVAHDIDVVVIFAPSAARLHGPYFEGFPELSQRPHFLEIVRGLAEQADFRFLDLYQALLPMADTELLYFRDDDHLNRLGNRLTADFIHGELMSPTD